MLHKNIITLLNITLAVCEAKDLQYFSSGFCLNHLKIALKAPPWFAENPALHLTENNINEESEINSYRLSLLLS